MGRPVPETAVGPPAFGVRSPSGRGGAGTPGGGGRRGPQRGGAVWDPGRASAPTHSSLSRSFRVELASVRTCGPEILRTDLPGGLEGRNGPLTGRCRTRIRAERRAARGTPARAGIFQGSGSLRAPSVSRSRPSQPLGPFASPPVPDLRPSRVLDAGLMRATRSFAHHDSHLDDSVGAHLSSAPEEILDDRFRGGSAQKVNEALRPAAIPDARTLAIHRVWRNTPMKSITKSNPRTAAAIKHKHPNALSNQVRLQPRTRRPPPFGRRPTSGPTPSRPARRPRHSVLPSRSRSSTARNPLRRSRTPRAQPRRTRLSSSDSWPTATPVPRARLRASLHRL